MSQFRLFFLFFLPLFASHAKDGEFFHYYCTVADENHYPLLINLIGSIHQNDFDYLDEIAVFDLGLTDVQKQSLSSVKKLKILPVEPVNQNISTYFKTDSNGRQVRGWYTWKPVIFKQALEIYPYFIYLDSGSTVLRSPIDLFKHISQNGYFLVHLSPIEINNRITKPVREKVLSKLLKQQADLIQSPETPMIDAGFQGISKDVFNSYVLSVYSLASDPTVFEDDGTAALGFGSARHDQTLFSIFAHANQMRMNNQGWSQLNIDGKAVPFHMHHDRNELNDLTTIYRSRADIFHGGDRSQYIHY